ncbi:MAG: aldehyde dehydrogenase family protein, partial [Polyangiaceae bacterium]
MADLVVDHPFTLEETVRRPYADDAAVDRILEAATRAARSWGRTSLGERAALCARAVEEMEAKR